MNWAFEVSILSTFSSQPKSREDESGDVLRTIGLFEHLAEADFLLVIQQKVVTVCFWVGNFRPSAFLVCHNDS